MTPAGQGVGHVRPDLRPEHRGRRLDGHRHRPGAAVPATSAAACRRLHGRWPRRAVPSASRVGWPSCSGPAWTCAIASAAGKISTQRPGCGLWSPGEPALSDLIFLRPRRTRPTARVASTATVDASRRPVHVPCISRGWMPPTGGPNWRSAMASSCGRSGVGSRIWVGACAHAISADVGVADVLAAGARFRPGLPQSTPARGSPGGPGRCPLTGRAKPRHSKDSGTIVHPSDTYALNVNRCA